MEPDLGNAVTSHTTAHTATILPQPWHFDGYSVKISVKRFIALMYIKLLPTHRKTQEQWPSRRLLSSHSCSEDPAARRWAWDVGAQCLAAGALECWAGRRDGEKAFFFRLIGSNVQRPQARTNLVPRVWEWKGKPFHSQVQKVHSLNLSKRNV